MNQSENLDYWRRYFRSSNFDLFCIIDQAIKLVSLDCPKEFKLRRDGIAETLFSCHLERCIGCDGLEYLSPNENDESVTTTTTRTIPIENGVSKENKITTGKDDKTRSFSYGEAETLTDEIDKENLIIKEVMRMKMILDNSSNETEFNVLNSLKKLQLMDLSVDILQTTEIGKSVNVTRKHPNKEIHNLARKLIEVWRKMVDGLMHMTTTFTEVTPQSCNPNVVNEEEEEDEEEEGLPAPPIDDFVFLRTYTSTMELSNFFDEIDEDGNIAELQPTNHFNTIRKPGQTLHKRKEQVEVEIVQEKKEKVLIKKPNFIIKQQKKSSISMESESQLDRKSTTMLDDRKLESTKRRPYQENDEFTFLQPRNGEQDMPWKCKIFLNEEGRDKEVRI
ncbi:probable mediator of RNA polymerase II transcription subunit 26b isoform X2 [Impatiens glandulifera]|uniref:probable mediator of RNA polymerase II transcription subunit 26b isoform X2 n=1 Tax=Impatiens glandulifera TaxID=253017 RepID=UPI001FB1937A|nr:probable mediator of RNA polymerase II transcription subunit 26b isoform X2 [Impatiens glandulifera]